MIKLRNVVLFILTAFLGLLSIILSPMLLPGESYSSPLFPLVATGIERFSPLTMFFLIISGMFPGYLSTNTRVWIWGVSTIFFLPFIAISEIIIDPTSHNLWPIEFTVSYGFIAIFGILGAMLGKYIRKRLQKV